MKRKIRTSISLVTIASLLIVMFPMAVQASPDEFEAGFFTLTDIIVFSYHDSTTIDIYDSTGSLLTTQTMDKGDHYYYNPGEGVYRVIGDKPYSLLTGDPITNYVNGYFAANDTYRGVAEEFYTYTTDDHDVIVFAYNSGTTDVNVEEWDGSSWVSLASFSLTGPGDYYYKQRYTWSQKWLHFTSNQPISVQCYSDRCFFVPDESGLWSGTHFYSFAGWYGGGDNIHVHSYVDSNVVTVKYIGGSTIWTGTLNDGEWVNIDRNTVGTNKYIEVTSTDTVTVSHEPYWTYDYYGLLCVQDETGYGIGTKFYTYARQDPPGGVGSIWVYAYNNGTSVEIKDMTTTTTAWTGTLDKNEYHKFTPTSGNGGHLFGIFSSNQVSIVEGSGGWGAEFVPLLFAAPPSVIQVYVDIKPGSWPNPITVKSKGVIPVAICGTEDFDVTTIDPATIQITLDPEEEGVSPLRWSYEDVATPWTGEDGGGHNLGGDGYLDLTLKFSTKEVVNTLGLENYAGQTIPLYIIGNLKEEEGGTPIEGHDWVWILESTTKDTTKEGTGHRSLVNTNSIYQLVEQFLQRFPLLWKILSYLIY